jgi:hypothetical protein
MAAAEVIRLLEELKIEVSNVRIEISNNNTYYALIERVNDAL